MIRVEDIDSEKTLWEIISETFISNGIMCYPPASKNGECKENYIVLKQAGSVQVESYSSEWVYYMLMLHVPRNKYTELERFENEVNRIIRESLYPMIKPTGLKNNDFYDDNINAHVRSFTVRSTKRNVML